jgi:hypothetical protein
MPSNRSLLKAVPTAPPPWLYNKSPDHDAQYTYLHVDDVRGYDIGSNQRVFSSTETAHCSHIRVTTPTIGPILRSRSALFAMNAHPIIG